LDRATTAVYTGSHQGQDGITPEDVMSIRGIVASPAGTNARIDALEETSKAEIRRLENKIDTHQNWSRPLLTAIAVGVVLLLGNAWVKPWLEGLLAKGAAPGPQMSVPVVQAVDAGVTAAPSP
jgi:uncharacterized paraquat-inducible protein A